VVVQVVSANNSQRGCGPLTNPPNDFLGYSIFAFLCCCFPIGIAAIISSVTCRAAIAVGDREMADIESRKAYRRASWAVGIGIVIIIVWVIADLSVRFSQ
jgi:Interferon-induced transmembrane protein